GHALPICPSVFDYRLQAANQSMLNTPPTYAIYMAGLTLQWIKAQRETVAAGAGAVELRGLAAVEARNITKARLLYDCIDGSQLYVNRVDPACRSRMNVPFFLRDETRNAAFLAGAEARGLLQLKGHKMLGGMRASLYNAMPLAGVQALVDWMREFERQP
ncbi:MAG: MFS transporter, partial [Comamonadaceae bacterium BICA1-1]